MRYTVSMLILTRYAVPVLMVLLSVTTASVNTAQFVPRSKLPSLQSYYVTSIHAILSDPGYYNLRIVRIRGVVQTITQVPHRTTCGLGVAYEIHVKDESGELTVIDLGSCGRNPGNRGPVLPETLAGGEQIDALVLVQQSGQSYNNPPNGLFNWVERAE